MSMEQFKRTITEVEEITDGLEHPVDKGIVEAVAVLIDLGFPTTGSCEGHEEHGIKYPWIDIAVDYPDSKERWSETIEPNRLLSERLKGLIVDFYDGRVTADRFKVGLTELGIFGGMRLQSFANKTQEQVEITDEDAKTAKEEMNAFTEFLKKQVHSE